MHSASRKASTWDIAIPVAVALAVMAFGVAGLLVWSASRTDSVSFARQEQLVSLVLERSAAKMAKEQQGLTMRDAAATWFLPTPPTDEPNLSQMDRNFGTFFYDYYGHDQSYVLTGANQPAYAMRDGRRVAWDDFARIRPVAEPVIAALREKTRHLKEGVVLRDSPGAYDIVVADGHPAILSVKPLMSHTGKLHQEPGTETVQISVLYLDGRFVTNLREHYLFTGARFSWTRDHQDGEAVRPFVSPQSGQVVGYLIWRPYTPGSTVLGDMMLALGAALLLVFLVTWSLIRKVRLSTAELKASEAQARHLAFHDVLTGLPNRALFEERLDAALAAVRRRQDPQTALLYLDLDHFKWVNDTLGHQAGDELIREVGRRLSNAVRKGDTVARLGGDEFAIVRTGVRSRRDIDGLCRRIQDALHGPFDLIGSQAFIGVSIGIARSPVDSSDRSELQRKADIALYQAKAAGRRCHVVFDKTMDTKVQYRRLIEAELREALVQGNQLDVHYQPQYDAATMQMTGVEALVRWNHPRLGLLWPASFVPIAEDTGLVEGLGEWVLAQACAAGLQWPGLLVSVNVSAVQLRNPKFAERICRIATDAQFDLKRLELEITETALLENLTQCQANLAALRVKGVSIALDDFGTGYSSLSHLRTFCVDRVKIDRSFIKGMDDANGSAIVQAIVDLAQSTGLKITAEGVETVEQSQLLHAAGCDELQGFGLASPMPLEAIDLVVGIKRIPASPRKLAA